MSENKFWLSFIVVFAVIILGISFFIKSYWVHNNELIADMVKLGADPIAIKCALQDDYGNHPICLILASKK